MSERYDDKIHVPDMASNSTGRLAASPPPTYEEAKPYLGYAWPGYSFDGKKEEIKYVFNRMRDAMQKCRGVVPYPQPSNEDFLAFFAKWWAGMDLEKLRESMNEPQWADGKHDGDCTRKPFTCNRCALEDIEKQATDFIPFLRVAPSGSAGQEPRYTDTESTIALINWRAGMREAAQIIESVCQGTDCEHSKKYAELIRKRVARTEAESEGRAESAAEPLHCQECHEPITFNGSYNQWFHADGTSTYPKCTRPKPPVVSASPAPLDIDVAVESIIALCASFQQKQGDLSHPGDECSRVVKETILQITPAAQPVAANPPKVEEIMRQIHEACTWGSVGKYISPDKVEEILGPFFTQVSQPPKLSKEWCEKMAIKEDGKSVDCGAPICTHGPEVDCVSPAHPLNREAYLLGLEIEKLPPSEQETKIITMLGDLRKKIRMLELAAPVTPVSPTPNFGKNFLTDKTDEYDERREP